MKKLMKILTGLLYLGLEFENNFAYFVYTFAGIIGLMMITTFAAVWLGVNDIYGTAVWGVLMLVWVILGMRTMEKRQW